MLHFGFTLQSKEEEKEVTNLAVEKPVEKPVVKETSQAEVYSLIPN